MEPVLIDKRKKLTLDQVKIIREMYATGRYTQKVLAHLNKVSPLAINAIVNGRTWK